MDRQDGSRVVETFLSHFGRSDLDAILAMMTEDATWWLNGKPHLHPDAGTRTKAQMAEAWRTMFAALDGPLHLDLVGMVEEDDRIAAELRSRATTRTGGRYENGYVMLFTVRDGRISQVRECTDLLHSLEIFGP